MNPGYGTPKLSNLSVVRKRGQKPYPLSDIAAENRCCDMMTAIAKHRDKKAFAELFQHFSPQIKAYALSKSGTSSSAEIADDVVQETVIKVWRRASLYDANKANVDIFYSQKHTDRYMAPPCQTSVEHQY